MKVVFVLVVVALSLFAICAKASDSEFNSECTYEKYMNRECMIVMRPNSGPQYVNSGETILLSIIFLFCLFIAYSVFKLAKVLLLVLNKAEQQLSK